MPDKFGHTHNNRRIESLQGHPQFLGRELFVLRAVEVQVQRSDIVYGFDMVDLLLTRQLCIPARVPQSPPCQIAEATSTNPRLIVLEQVFHPRSVTTASIGCVVAVPVLGSTIEGHRQGFGDRGSRH
jgi:hypothetical protein